MLIGQDVQRTERVLQLVVSALDRASFPSSAGSIARKVFHSLQRPSMVEDNETLVK
jgi:hypothetical protein